MAAWGDGGGAAARRMRGLAQQLVVGAGAGALAELPADAPEGCAELIIHADSITST